MNELILGGGKNGKSRCAELRAKDWLQVSGQCALLIATATPGDDEMRERIARHREQRALWLTQQLMPMVGPQLDEQTWLQQEADLCDAVGNAAGPVVRVTNEIGMGVAPLGRDVRRYLDALGALHQRVAPFCERVTLMVAGIEMKVKE